MKFWKNLPSWVQGGIIGLVIFLILSLFPDFSYNLFGGDTPFSEMLYNLISRMPVFLSSVIIPINSYDEGAGFSRGITIPPLFWFTVGAIVGLVVGSLKKKKQIL